MIFTYTNEYGDSITFSAASVFHLKDVSGISSNSMTISDAFTPAQVGTTVTGSKVDAKTIELKGDYRNTNGNRDTLLAIVVPGSGRLIMDDGTKRVFVDVEVQESPDIDAINPLYDEFTFVLYAAYPYWKSASPISSGFVDEKAQFKFPATFSSTTGFYVSTREITQIKDILNSSPMPIGFVAEFRASGFVSDPEFTKIDTQERIRFVGLEMQDGDVVRISTLDSGKYVRLVNAEGDKNIFHLLDDSSRFFKLDRGQNTIQYECKSGLKFLTFDIVYFRQYVGV